MPLYSALLSLRKACWLITLPCSVFQPMCCTIIQPVDWFAQNLVWVLHHCMQLQHAPLILLILLLLPAVQPFVNHSLFQNCPPLLSVLQHTSPVPHTLVLLILLNWLKPPQLRFSYTSIAFCLRTVSFLLGYSSYILQRCPGHLNLPVFITLTMSGSSYTA